MSHRRTTPATIRYGTPRKRAYAAERAKPGMSPAERIKMHVAVDPATGCWNWQLALVPRTGYGALTIDRKRHLAHRLSYETFVGPIPAGLQIDHLCRNRACCNPAHLEPVTPMVNNHRSPLTHCAKTHCPRGHEYNEANTYLTSANRRMCRPCRKVYLAIFRSMTPEERAARKAAGLPLVDLDAYFAEQQRQVRAA